MVGRKLGFRMFSVEMSKRSYFQELGMIQVCAVIQHLVLGAEDITNKIDLFPRWILQWKKTEPTSC